MKVLLVDDEIDFATTLSKRLRLRGMGVDVVHDGQQALDYVHKREPDVMVLDLKMPGLPGMEVLARLSTANPDLQVIILTGHGTDLEEKEARRLNAFDYLRKPTDIYTLADRIQAAYIYKMRKTGAAALAEGGQSDMARRVAQDRETLRANRQGSKQDKK
jgi:DNA-binding response OmpR family regulator